MKIKSLLAAVSLVALSTGTAHALNISAPVASGNPFGVLPANTNTGDVLALELDLATANVNGLYDFDITRGAAAPINGAAGTGFPTGTPLTVTITLPAGRTINGNATGLSITSGIESDTASNGVGNVTAGGTAGSSSITFTITVANVADDFLRVRGLPVSASADVNGAPLTVSVVANGAEIDAAVATDVTSIAPASTAVVFADSSPAIVASAVAPDGTNTQVSLTAPIYTLLSEGGVDVATNAQTPIGLINHTLVPNRQVSLLNAAGTAVAKSAFTAADLTSLTFVVQPSVSTTGLGAANFVANGGATVSANPVGGAYAFTIPGATVNLLDGTADSISIASAPAGPGVAAIASQGVAVTSATLNLNSTAGRTFLATVPSRNGQIDNLDRVGLSFGPFDWNGQTGTNSVYRVTGLPTTVATTGTATFTNTVGGANGTFPFVISAADAADGEAVLQSFTGFNTGNTAYTRTDVQFNFEVALATPLDVDRLMARSGVISAFGDTANGGVVAAGATIAD